MRRLALALGALLSLACAKSDAPPVADAAAAPAINLADLAGTWNTTATLAGTDSVIVQFTIVGSADPAGWTMNLPGRNPLPMTITVSGDSILTSVGPYESVLRAGMAVEVTGSMRLTDGNLAGPSVAHYATADADSSVSMWVMATRAP